MKQNIVFLSTVDFTDRKIGKGIVVAGINDYLSNNASNFSYQFILFNSKKFSLSGLVLPNFFSVVLNILYFSIILRSKSIQECFFWKRSNCTVIRNLFREHTNSIFVFDTIRTSQYLNYIDDADRERAIIYLDDLFSLRYERMIGCLGKGKVDPLGNFARYIPKIFKSIFLSSRLFIRFVLNFERSLVKKAEDKSSLLARKVLLINPFEVDFLKNHTGYNNVFECPPRLAVNNAIERNYSGAKTILFLGALNLSHNKTGLIEFLVNVFPLILKKEPGAIFNIVGSGADLDVKSHIENFPEGSVNLLGRVESLDVFLSNSAMLVAPLIIGSGVKIKCIDALSSSLPIVATTIGAEGIPLVKFNAGFVTDDWAEFADKCLLLFDVELNNEISIGANKLFSFKYDLIAVDRVYSDIFYN